MSRAARLLDLIDALRARRQPVTGAALAAELGVSLRTLYRDIETLRGQGAPIDGEAGVGFILRAGFMLPPLMFPDEEVEALALGLRWVVERGDPALADSARRALSRVAAVLPPAVRQEMELESLMVGPGEAMAEGEMLARLRRAIRERERIVITYRSPLEQTVRPVWPLTLAFFDKARVLAAWCELRQDFRHFRTDRITDLSGTGAPYPGRKAELIRRWQATIGR